MPHVTPAKTQGALTTQRYLQHHGLAELESMFAVHAKPHQTLPQLISLRYTPQSPKAHPIVRECRGLILDQADNWRVVSYGYERFFNYNEPQADTLNWQRIRVLEKLDGVLVTLYCYEGHWHVSAEGFPDGRTRLGGVSITELFWHVWTELGYTLPHNDKMSYMFELITPASAQVVVPEGPRLVLHGVRELRNYQELSPEPIAKAHNWACVQSYPLSNMNHVIAQADYLDGTQAEGFIVVDDQFKRLKVKSPHYVALQHLSGASDTEDAVLEEFIGIVKRGDAPELVAYHPQYAKTLQKAKRALEIRHLSVGARLEGKRLFSII